MAVLDLSYMANQPRPKALRKHVIGQVRKHVKGKRLAVPLSGGADSHVCLFAALEAGLTPTVYSFTLEDRESRDFRTARATANHFGLEFVPVYLSLDVEELRRHVWEISHRYLPQFQVGKSTIECMWPIARMLDVMREPVYLLGFGADAVYCSARRDKKEYLAGNYWNNLVRYYSTPEHHLQLLFMERYAKSKRYVTPLYTPEVLPVWEGFDPFDKTHNPTNKAVSRAAFWDYFSQVRVFGQQPFQKGDTGIADHFETLLETDWQGEGKTVKAIYNAVQFKHVSPPPGVKTRKVGPT